MGAEETRLLLSSPGGGNQPGTPLDEDNKFDVCFVFNEFDDDDDKGEKRMSSAEVQTEWLDICYVRSFAGVKSEGGDVSDSVKAIPDFYELNSKRMEGMTKKQFHHTVLLVFISTLQNVLGCSVEASKSVDERVTMVSCRLPEDRLRVLAESLKYPVQLDRRTGSDHYLKYNPLFVPPYLPYDSEMEHGKSMNCTKSLGRVWTRYSENGHRNKHRSIGNPDEVSCFRNIDRIRLLINSVKKLFNLHILQDREFMDCYYPLHDMSVVRKLKEEWGSFKYLYTTKQPIEKIRKYFGEEVALYFDWMSTYTQALYGITVCGIIVAFLRFWFDPQLTFDNPWLDLSRVVYGIVLSMWCTWFDRIWKRREILHSLRWGTQTAEYYCKNVYERQEFQPDCWIKNPVQPDKEMRHASRKKQFMRHFISGCISFFTIIFVFIATNERTHALIAETLGLRAMSEMTGRFLPPSLNSWVPDGTPILTSIAVIFFNKIFGYLSSWLTDFENHQYEDDYKNSLVLKLFSFSALDYFAPLFFVAIIKMYMNHGAEEVGGAEGKCLKDLQLQLLWLCVLSFTTNAVELGMPFASQKYHQLKAVGHSKHKENNNNNYLMTENEKDYYKNQYDDTTDDFQEMMLQLLLLSFFSTALPFLPLMCILINHLEIRVDSIKLCSLTRRPYPHPRQTIGSWSKVLTVVCGLAVVVNIGLAAFTTFGKNLPLSHKLFVCAFSLMMAFSAKELVSWWVPLNSAEVELLQKQQQAFTTEAMWGRRMMTSSNNTENKKHEFLTTEELMRSHGPSCFEIMKPNTSRREQSGRVSKRGMHH